MDIVHGENQRSCGTLLGEETEVSPAGYDTQIRTVGRLELFMQAFCRPGRL